MKQKFLKDLEIEVGDKGFTIWTKERVKVKGKFRTIRHWVLDGSMVKETGVISIGTKGGWKISAEFDEINNSIRIVKSSAKKKSR